ncbi:uncharacterized protein SETTUDRAFT_85189 [Exserohilum turcica Et28A]|uniref:Uncharacterized protein n=1 Tax=Exserohilum turcicum (strain 28A) TaxID=671987 RepID=R0KHF6_EXST2|nr:uncharacterized protein SETTUDRAFT_85189 [Exserohilum turcica Et28A]EOA92323.1 hypothetical protein SETTUDRAFT_85189 [Exserohilum turcica Et28A]
MHQAWKEVRHDLRNARWNGVLLGKILIPLLVVLWVIGLIAIPIVFLYFFQNIQGTQQVCTPGGQFNLNPEDWSYWSRTGFFQITLSFGDMSFDKAKLIDVIWDMVVGRGGQVLIALCSWHVFGLYVTTSMETAPITYHSYRAVFLETSPSFWSTLFLARDFIWLKSLHSKMAMFFMIFTMVFTLCFPTFASAMTGYTSIVQAYVLDRQNANWIRFDTFAQVIYVVDDGNRIGQTEPYYVVDKVSWDSVRV